MTTRLFPIAASALLTVMLAPAAFAGDRGTHYDPYAAARRAPVCTQAELSAGVDVDDCGRVLIRSGGDRAASRQTNS
jgi:hypothetical protein